MASLDSLRIREKLATGVTRQNGTNGPIALRLRKVSAGTVTSVTVTTATDLVLITSDGGTDTYTFSTYTTVGKLADAINGDGIFEAKVMDTLRSLNIDTSSFLLDGAITAGSDDNGVSVWDVKTDTSVSLQISVGLLPSYNFGAPSGHRVQLQQVVYSVNMGTAAEDSFQIWRRRGTTETQVLGALSVDTTETTLNLALGYGSIGGADGDEIVVLVKDAATLADSTSNFVRVVGIQE